MNTSCKCNPKHSSNCIQVSGKANGKHPATTQTQINYNISETAHNTRPRKRCRKRTDTANAGTFRTLHICVPSSGTGKINCGFEQQTVTREETHARNAGKTQKTGTHDTTDSRAPNSVTLVCTMQQCAHRTEGSARGVHERPCSMQTNNSHVFGSDALLSNTIHTETEKRFKQHTAPRIPSRCGADIALTTLPANWCNSVACRTFRGEIAARIRPYLTCVELRKTHIEGPNCVSELANQRSKHVRQLTSSASFLATVQATAQPHTLFEQRTKMTETTTSSRNAKSRKT